MSATLSPLTVEQFLRLPEEETERRELIEGEVVPMGNAGRTHEIVKAAFVDHLSAYNREKKIGGVFPETMFRLGFSEVRVPDVSFVLAHRILPGEDPFEGGPDLAIEIVSSESAASLERKVERYLEHGSRAVWVVYPELRTVMARHVSGETRHYRGDDYLEDPHLLPGFRVQVRLFFEGIGAGPVFTVR